MRARKANGAATRYQNQKDNPVAKSGKTDIIKSKHSTERAMSRNIPEEAVQDALKNPLHKGEVVIDKFGRPSVKYIGKDATVCVNPETNTVTTMWQTGTRTRKKYSKKDGD